MLNFEIVHKSRCQTFLTMNVYQIRRHMFELQPRLGPLFNNLLRPRSNRCFTTCDLIFLKAFPLCQNFLISPFNDMLVVK